MRKAIANNIDQELNKRLFYILHALGVQENQFCCNVLALLPALKPRFIGCSSLDCIVSTPCKLPLHDLQLWEVYDTVAMSH